MQRGNKTYGHNAFQVHIHTSVINSDRAHTVGSDCGYNPGCHPTVSEMT